MKTYLILFVIVSLAPSFSYANIQVAKALIVRGDVQAVSANGSSRKINKGDWLNQGDKVKTKKASIVKLLFKDNSRMSLAPNSEAILKDFKAKEGGLISGIKGQLRSSITKNQLKKETKKTRFMFKTKTAAIGVRGTDLHIFYNEENERTMLLTYTGEVAMASLAQADIGQVLDSLELEKLLESDTSVLVEAGEFSEVNPDHHRASEPTRISPEQFQKLRSNSDFLETAKTEKSKAFPSIAPPNTDTKIFANQSLSDDSKISEAKNEPEGFFDKESGKYALTAGGFIDPNTAQYISPPPGSQYDAVAKVFIPPTNFGSFDLATGKYIAPVGYKLTVDGKFITINKKTKQGDKEAPFVMTLKEFQVLFIGLDDDNFLNEGDLDEFLNNFIELLNEEIEIDDEPEVQKSNSTLKFDFTVA